MLFHSLTLTVFMQRLHLLAVVVHTLFVVPVAVGTQLNRQLVLLTLLAQCSTENMMLLGIAILMAQKHSVYIYLSSLISRVSG